jgi:starch synthase
LSKKIKVLSCASEVAPFEKTGGLADVTGSLPKAMASHGVETLVMMPKYRGVQAASKKIAEGAEARFIAHEEYFNRSGLYGNERGDYPDNLQRFSFFCHQALVEAKTMGFRPDIVHVHDWQASLIPVLLRAKSKSDDFFKDTKTVLTIHNIAYQGLFPHRQYGTLGLDPSLFKMEGLEFYGKINLLKGGMMFSDALTTVSPTYVKETQTREFGFGLEGVLRKRSKDYRGILNGLDTAVWDPSSDKSIAAAFSPADISGKAKCKAALQRASGLAEDPDAPLFAMVTRLAEQKGLDLVSEAADKLLGGRAQFVLLGEGDAVYHTTFANIGKRYPKNSRMYLDFDGAKAHTIYAGADFFLMPSLFEPCGLGQMIAMRYGALPIVRNVGGLADTVRDADETADGNGFVFDGQSPEKLLSAIGRALALWDDKARLAVVRKRGMSADFSWDASAKEYLKLYEGLLN